MQFILVLCAVALCTRIYCILPGLKKTKRANKSTKPRKLAVFLGSGGHTSEMLALISSLDFEKYSPRIYIISEGDTLSEQKAILLEAAKATEPSQNSNVYKILIIPRARKVHQPLFTTLGTALVSLFKCVFHVTIESILFSQPGFADVLILNGPGTCCILCAAVYINKLLGLPTPTTLYIESFARVKTLSLSGKLLHYFVDRFIVQWPQLLENNNRAEYHGWLI